MGDRQVRGVDGAEGAAQGGAQLAGLQQLGEPVEDLPCRPMSAVWNWERLNMNSQANVTLLALSRLRSRGRRLPTIATIDPSGAMSAAITSQ